MPVMRVRGTVLDMAYVQVTSPTPGNVTPVAPGQLTANAEAYLPVLNGGEPKAYIPHTTNNLPFDGKTGTSSPSA